MSEKDINSLLDFFINVSKDIRIILIKIASRIDNVVTVLDWMDDSKKKRIAKETLDIYVPIIYLLSI
jgi:(p)ppGpp synthase/HD superfamily hydrolase